MKFFGWMQNKLGGKEENKKSNTLPPSHHKKQESREEFSDWPHGLLAIGTFGNSSNEVKEIKSNHEISQNMEENDPSSSEEILDFSPEEVGKLQKELTKLLSRKRKQDVEKQVSSADLPLDRFLNCPSSLEVDRRISTSLCSDSGDRNKDDEDIERTISLIIGKCKDICADKYRNKSIGKKSVSFLLKKMFVCSSGFAPAPSLRDTLQESRMEKLLRTLLHKKINPQTSRAPSMKKFIEDKRIAKNTVEEETGSKWVKTDSEYIVLEI